MKEDIAKGKQSKPKTKPNAFKRAFFCWLVPIFHKGQTRELEEEDLVPTKKLFHSDTIGDKLEKAWFREIDRCTSVGTEASLIKVLWSVFKWRFLIILLPNTMNLTLRTVQPLLFANLLTYWQPDSPIPLVEAIYYAAGVVLCSYSAAFMNHHSVILQQQLGMALRVASTSLMFRKMMRMSNRSLNDTAAGKIINLMSNDVSRFDIGFMFIHQLLLLPIQMAFVIYFMYNAAGISAIIGITVMLIIILPIQGGLSKLAGKMRQLSAVRTDKRIKIMDEIISGIQVIKMYAWEMPFSSVVSEVRRDEMKAIRKAGYVRATSIGFMMITERSSLFLCLLAYTLLTGIPNASMVYPLQQYFSLIQAGIGIYLPMGVAFTAEMLISIRRIKEFLLMDERPDLAIMNKQTKNITPIFKKKTSKGTEEGIVTSITYNQNHDRGHDNKGFINTEKGPSSEYVLEVKEATARWNDEGKDTISNLSLRLKQGKMCAVIGSVGAGKSSFLQLLLKELPLVKGAVNVNGVVSYSSQEAWLFPKTVRENILFGLPYDADKYKQVCKVCCLEKDFKQFPFSDQTLVGERGVSLSGGQRARINLARAVYREADIYLLDDPLSAVDANVGGQLFDRCISGYLSGKTRILVTHQIHYLTNVDMIVVLNEGKIENIGTYEDLVKSSKDFKMLLNSLEEETKASETPEKRPSLKKLESVTSETSEISEFEAQVLAPEERSKGRLKLSVLQSYCTAAGFWPIAITLVLIAISQTAATGIDYWISYWMNQVASWTESNAQDPSLNSVMSGLTNWQYLTIYGSLVVTVIIAVNLRAFSFVTFATRSSTVLHERMFTSMLKAVMRFFDTSSSGRILNRFSKDMGSVDEQLPRCFLDMFQIHLSMTSVLILNAISLPWTLISTSVLLVINFFMLKMYLNASQAIKRIEGVTKSPVFGMVSSSLSGITTIRSANAEERHIREFDKAQDLHTYAWNTYLGGGAAFGFFLDSICVVYISFVLATFLFVDFDGVIPIGSVGLAVSQSLVLMFLLQFGARITADLLGQLTAIERILEYTNLETERNLLVGDMETPPSWPKNGAISFENVSMSYVPGGEPVLKNLNFYVEGGAKIGIVGRTGAGKSSLISALFRFAHIEGIIKIDGIDTNLLAKQELRKKISIIPQEPVLFSATIRYNLDPFQVSSDEDIWRALELVELKDAIPDLDFKVSEGGSNFSVGQRQLVCLARAILKSNKVLIMDEATANVDPQTDSFIQQTIRKQFAECTVLTIAHRLNTIMDSDLVLVMDTGEAVEFDHPYTLMLDPNSKFNSMAKEVGVGMYKQLLDIARQTFESRSSNFKKKEI